MNNPTIETRDSAPHNTAAANGNSNGNGAAIGNDHAQHHDDEHAVPTDLPKQKTSTVIMMLGLLALVLVAMFFIGWIPKHREEASIRADAQAHATDGVVVSVSNPKPSANVKDVVLPCDVRANQTTDLYPRSNGYLKKWYVDIQDHVESGQLLAEIEAPEIDAQLAQSKANLELSKASVAKAETDLKLAGVTLKRYIDAQKSSPGSVTQEDVDAKVAANEDAAAALAQAKANVAASDANVQQLSVMQSFEKVTAPFAGTITARNYDNGALLNPANSGAGKQLFSLAQTDILRVYVNVPQTYASNIHPGKEAFAYLRVRNYPNQEFKGTITRTSGSLDPTTRTLLVEIDFPNPDGSLLAGMYGDLRLPVASRDETMIIPTSAVVFNAAGLQVGVVQDGKIHIKKITVGRDLGTEMEVVTGLDKNDNVVTNPGARMAEGIEVKVNTPDGDGQPKKAVADAR